MNAENNGDSNIWTNPLATGGSLDNISVQKVGLEIKFIHPRYTIKKYNSFQTVDNLNGRVSSNDNRIPDSIQRELDKRRIGDR